MRPFIAEKLVYPVYQARYGPFFGIGVLTQLSRIRGCERAERAQNEALRSAKLRALVRHCLRNVPFYRDYMIKEKLSYEDFVSVRDISLLPPVTKKEIRDSPGRFLSEDVRKRKRIWASTGGSTGEPLRFLRDYKSLAAAEASALRGMGFAGFRPGKRVLDFTSPGRPGIAGRIRAGIMGIHCFDAFAGDEKIAAAGGELSGIGAFCVKGYASNLYRIAKIAEKHGIRLKMPVIFSTGEMLYDEQREYMEGVFGGEVFDYYGSNETGPIAFECENHRKHISDERLIVETLGPDGRPVSGVPGEVAVTDLDSYAMPFIRYRLGDVASLSEAECECGRRLTVIEALDGRTQDFIRSTDGSHVPSIYFPVRFRGIRGIEQYQIHQAGIGKITLKLVKNEHFSQSEAEYMARVIKEAAGEGTELQIQECTEIPRTARGKVRLVVSEVSSGF